MANGSEKRAGIVISALRGGSGKTMVSLGLIAALASEGRQVASFKKGPDYIDAGWLCLAAGRPCYNLDTFLIAAERIRQTFHVHTRDTDVAVIEGNRGIYDCIDTHGETSTAELAKLLGLPILLIIDGTKTTRTMAAVVKGCSLFDPSVRIGGVVLNRIAGSKSEQPLTTAAIVRVVLVPSIISRMGSPSSLASSAVLVSPWVSIQS